MKYILVTVFGWVATSLCQLGEMQLQDTSESLILHSSVGRELASRSFPRVSPTKDEEEILEKYETYLRFVLDVGNRVNRKASKKLKAIYSSMKMRDPSAAAKFLKGLRFEMIQKMELSGMHPKNMHSHSPEMRRWVAKFLPLWVYEADEQWFRARTDLAFKGSLVE